MKPILRTMTTGILDENHPDHMVGLHMALDDAIVSHAAPGPKVADLLQRRNRRSDSDFILCGCHQGTQLIAAALVIRSPGGAGLVHFGVDDKQAMGRTEGAVACLNDLVHIGNEQFIELLEVLVNPSESFEINILSLSTFSHLTNLIYLTRDSSRPSRSFFCPLSLAWVSYDNSQDDLFCQTLQATYSETLDCKELSGLRPARSVLEDHRATGVFTPARWWVATTPDGPAGVILVNKIEFQPASEIVYLGVAQNARGKGVSDALLCRIVDTSRFSGDILLTLAVDERNAPARNMYDRWDFEQVLKRQAWIVISSS